MSEVRKIQIQDGKGNIYHPQTVSDQILDLDERLEGLAKETYVDEKIAAIPEIDLSDIENNISTLEENKADKTELDNLKETVDKKADKTDVTSQLSLKADKTEVEALKKYVSIFKLLAKILAIVVLPVPGGPYKINDKGLLFFIIAVNIPFSETKWSCPKTSLNDLGRIWYAKGSIVSPSYLNYIINELTIISH